MAFTFEERQALGIHGLLPPRVKTQEEQIQHCKLCLDRLDDPLNKYLFLMGLLVIYQHKLNCYFKQIGICRTVTKNCSTNLPENTYTTLCP